MLSDPRQCFHRNVKVHAGSVCPRGVHHKGPRRAPAWERLLSTACLCSRAAAAAWMVGWRLRSPGHASSSCTHWRDQDTKPTEGGMEAQRGQWVSYSQLCPRCLEQHLAHRRHSGHFCCMNRPHLRRWERTRFSALITLSLGVATELRAEVQSTEGAGKHPRQPPPLCSHQLVGCAIFTAGPGGLREHSCFSSKAVN